MTNAEGIGGFLPPGCTDSIPSRRREGAPGAHRTAGKRQSAAYLTARLLRVLSAGTAAAAAVLGGVLLWLGKGGAAVATAVCYGLAAALLAGAVVWSWRRDRWQLGAYLRRKRGIALNEEYCLKRESLTAVTARQTPFLALFDSVRVSLHTSADSDKSCCSLTVRRSDARRLSRRLLPAGGGYVRRYRAGWGSVVLLSLSKANFFGGLVWLLPLTVWLTENIDKAIARRIDEAIAVTGRLLLPGLSPVSTALVLLPAAGWAVNLLAVFFSCGGFSLMRSGELITLRHGLLSRQSVSFCRSEVTALERRKTLLTALFGRERCRITVPGCPEQELLMPEGERTLSIEISSIFPHGAAGVTIASPAASRWWRWWAAGSAAMAVLAVRLCLEPGNDRMAVLLTLLPAVVLFGWRCAVCIMASGCAGVYSYADSVEIVGVRGFAVCRLRVMRGSIAKARLTQNPFERACGLCSLYICAAGAKRGVRCRHLPQERCRFILGRLG